MYQMNTKILPRAHLCTCVLVINFKLSWWLNCTYDPICTKIHKCKYLWEQKNPYVLCVETEKTNFEFFFLRWLTLSTMPRKRRPERNPDEEPSNKIQVKNLTMIIANTCNNLYMRAHMGFHCIYILICAINRSKWLLCAFIGHGVLEMSCGFSQSRDLGNACNFRLLWPICWRSWMESKSVTHFYQCTSTWRSSRAFSRLFDAYVLLWMIMST